MSIRRRGAVAAVSALILIAGLSSCSGSSSGGGSSQSNPLNLITPGVLRVGVTSADKPFAYQDASGNWIGFEPDLVSNVAKRAGIDKIEYVEQDFSSMLAAVASRKYDIAAGCISATNERKKMVDFVSDYFNGFGYFMSKANAGITSAEKLAGKRVGVETGSVEETYVREKIPSASVVGFPDPNTAVQSLLSGSVDTVFIDSPQTYVKQYPQLVLNFKVEGDTPCAWPISKQDTALKAALDRGMAAAIADGTVEKVTKQWVPDAPVFPEYMPKP